MKSERETFVSLNVCRIYQTDFKKKIKKSLLRSLQLGKKNRKKTGAFKSAQYQSSMQVRSLDCVRFSALVPNKVISLTFLPIFLLQIQTDFLGVLVCYVRTDQIQQKNI